MSHEKSIFILLHGDIGIGKSTIGDYLVARYGYTQVSYADNLKDHVAQIYNIDRKCMDSQDGKMKPLLQYPAVMTTAFTRKLFKEIFIYLRTSDGKGVTDIREIGTDRPDSKIYISNESDPYNTEILYHTPRSILILEGCLKLSIDPYFWVTKAYEGISNEGAKKIVVPDFRFPAEYYGTLEKYGKNSLIFPILVHNTEKPTTPKDVSQSSLISFTFDYKIENNKKSLDELYSKIDDFMAMLASSGYQ